MQNVKVGKANELRKMLVSMEESAVEDLEWQDVVAAERLAADLLVDENDEEMVPVKRETKKEVVNMPRSKVLNVGWIDGWMSYMRPSIKAIF